MAISDKPASRRAATPPNADVGDLFVRKFKLSNIYVAILILLAAAIVWSGIKTAEGVQQYHQDYKTLQDMKKQERKLQVEHQRLLIEQQTFSATPQIASRAVAELGMFSPTLRDKLIIQPGAATAVALVDPDASTSDVVAANDSDIIETDVANDTANGAASDAAVEVSATDSELVEAGQ